MMRQRSERTVATSGPPFTLHTRRSCFFSLRKLVFDTALVSHRRLFRRACIQSLVRFLTHTRAPIQNSPPRQAVQSRRAGIQGAVSLLKRCSASQRLYPPGVDGYLGSAPLEAPRPPFLAGTAGIVAGGARACKVTYFWTRPRGNRRERRDELTCSRGLTKRRPLLHCRPRRHLERPHSPRHGKGGLLVAVVGTDAG